MPQRPLGVNLLAMLLALFAREAKRRNGTSFKSSRFDRLFAYFAGAEGSIGNALKGRVDLRHELSLAIAEFKDEVLIDLACREIRFIRKVVLRDVQFLIQSLF